MARDRPLANLTVCDHQSPLEVCVIPPIIRVPLPKDMDGRPVSALGPVYGGDKTKELVSLGYPTTLEWVYLSSFPQTL